MSDLVELVARAIHKTKGTNPDCLYQHNFEGDYPEDERREFSDPFTGEPRVQLFHRAWRQSVPASQAAIEATGVVELREALASVLPSAAGTSRRPDTDVIAFYINLGELRTLRALAMIDAVLGEERE